MSILNARFHPRRVLTRFLPMSFILQGQWLSGAELVDFSLGGVGVWMDERHAVLFEPNGRLRDVQFHDSAIYSPAPDIRIVFSTLPGQSARPGMMMFGGEFISPSPEFLASLELFLALP